jgi:hypothetical protein
MMGYCRSCSIVLEGRDREDFAGILGGALSAEGYGVLAVCDECGPMLVDGRGQRIAPQPAMIDCDA